MKIIIIALIALWASALGRVPVLDWDEANFAEIAREMVATRDWSFVKIGFEPFWEKPPLFMWLQASAFKLFGVNEFAARFPNLIVALFTFLFISFVGQKRSKEFSRIWMFAYAGSFLPSFYFRTGLIDPLFNLFIFSSIIFWFEFEKTRKIKELAIATLLIACGIMTKGPTALLMMGVSVVGVWALHFKSRFKLKNVAGLSGLAAVGLIPYALWMQHQGTLNQGKVATDFVSYLVRLFATADAGHGGFPLYHVVVLAVGCLPLSIYLQSGWKVKDHYSDLMRVLLVAVVVIFSLVQTKIIHYSSLAYFPLTYLGALGIEARLKKNEGVGRGVLIMMGVFFSILVSLPLLLFSDSFLKLIRDPDLIESALSFRMSTTGSLLIAAAVMVIVGWLSLILSKQKLAFTNRKLLFTLLASIEIFMSSVVPRLAEVAQGSLISFYKRAAQEKVNIQPLGFKSFAAYFYSEYDPARGQPVYAVSRSRDSDWAMKNHKLTLLEKKGGWALYRMLR